MKGTSLGGHGPQIGIVQGDSRRARLQLFAVEGLLGTQDRGQTAIRMIEERLQIGICLCKKELLQILAHGLAICFRIWIGL